MIAKTFGPYLGGNPGYRNPATEINEHDHAMRHNASDNARCMAVEIRAIERAIKEAGLNGEAVLGFSAGDSANGIDAMIVASVRINGKKIACCAQSLMSRSLSPADLFNELRRVIKPEILAGLAAVDVITDEVVAAVVAAVEAKQRNSKQTPPSGA